TDAADSTLRAEPALDADLHRDPGQLRVELAELRDHVVDGPGVAEELAADRQIGALLVHALAQVALGDRGHDPRDLAHVVGQAVEHGVLRVDQRAPTTAHAVGPQPPLGPALLDHRGRQLAGVGAQLRRGLGDVVEGRTDLTIDPLEVVGQADIEVAALEGPQRGQQRPAIERLGHGRRMGVVLAVARAGLGSSAIAGAVAGLDALAGHRRSLVGMVNRPTRAWPSAAPRTGPVWGDRRG